MYQELSFISKMLRSEAKWFSRFLRLCKDKLLVLLLRREENSLIPLLEKILTCYSYRQVITLLRRHHWTTRQVIFELRKEARRRSHYPITSVLKDQYLWRFHNP